MNNAENNNEQFRDNDEQYQKIKMNSVEMMMNSAKMKEKKLIRIEDLICNLGLDTK